MSDDHKPQSGHADAHGEQAHGFAHVLPLKLLFGVWGLLMVLTIITVTVTSIDLGRTVNLSIAMAIATIKAGLVGLYFMHLRWDRPFNAMVFTASILFVALFISMTLLDKSEYEPDITDYELIQAK